MLINHRKSAWWLRRDLGLLRLKMPLDDEASGPHNPPLLNSATREKQRLGAGFRPQAGPLPGCMALGQDTSIVVLNDAKGL